MEHRERGMIVDSIVRRMAELDYELQQDRIDGLKGLHDEELRKVENGVSSAKSSAEGRKLIVEAIVDHRNAEIEADRKKWDAVDGGKPATVSMDL